MQAQINKGEAVVPTAGIIELVKDILPEDTQMDEVNFSGDDNTYYLNYRTSDCRVFLQIYLPEDIINKTVVVYKRDGDVKVAYGNNNNAKYTITKGKTYFKLG